MQHDMTTMERWFRQLQSWLSEFGQRLSTLEHKVGQAAEDGSRDNDPGGQSGSLTMLHVTTACNAMSGATPGNNGRGKVQAYSGTSYSDLSSDIYVIVNDTEKIVAVGAYVLCGMGPGGRFHLVTVDKCSNLS